MKNILFVCTGNICRSPMAEGLFRHLAKGRNDLEVSSAGVGAVHGQPPSLHAVEVLRPWGIDISQCRSQPLTEEQVEKATAIFAMTRAHLDTIQMLFPSAAEKAYLVCEFDEELAGAGGDIADPIGQGIEAYFQCRDVMKKALPSVLAFIQKTGENPGVIKEAAAPKRPLRIALGSDASGRELRRNLHTRLSNKGYMVTECGSRSEEMADYPELAAEVCREIIAQHCDYGILLCANGTGAVIAANRYPRVRALLAESEEKARTSRQQIDSNLLALSTGETDGRQVERIVDAFLQTPFAGGQYEQRVAKLQKLGMGRPNESLAETDAEVFNAIEAEGKRQSENIELIASENFTSRAVMEAQGSVMTNKYAEGYPRRRWYGGCENMDTVEQLAIDRARKLFGGEHINVQAHSGSQANMAVYFSALEPGDRILTMDLSHGGHLTHGFKANFSGRFFEVSHYGVSRENERIDYDALAAQAEQFKPKMITAGASAYSRIIDFPRLRQIADSVGAYLFVDMAHIAGLVAAGVHPSPVPEADFVTSTTHKSLRGPRGGINICREKFAKQIDSQIFPGIQGGPLMHVISAKAVCFHEALRPEFREYQRQVVFNAKALAAGMSKNGYRIVSQGTDNHLMLVDLRPHGLNGKDSQETLDHAGITVNKNGIPFDTLPISKGGGIRLGTPAVTTRGMKEEEMMEIADLIHDSLKLMSDLSGLAEVKKRVINLTQRFPLPY